MKAAIYSIFLVATITLLVVGCEEKDPVTSGINGHMVNHSDCKNFKSGDLKFDTADTLSCVNYAYDSLNQVLVMIHYNSAFNCCPGGIKCEVSTVFDTIFIREYEKEQGCDCNCLFDLDIELSNVDQYKYIVKFVEPYAEGQEVLVFEMDLTSSIDGEYCAVRKSYPWGE